MDSIKLHAFGVSATVAAEACPICPGNLKFYPHSAFEKHLEKHPSFLREQVCISCGGKFTLSKFSGWNPARCPQCRKKSHGGRGPRRGRGVVEKKESIPIGRH